LGSSLLYLAYPTLTPSEAPAMAKKESEGLNGGSIAAIVIIPLIFCCIIGG